MVRVKKIWFSFVFCFLFFVFWLLDERRGGEGVREHEAGDGVVRRERERLVVLLDGAVQMAGQVPRQTQRRVGLSQGRRPARGAALGAGQQPECPLIVSRRLFVAPIWQQIT